MSPTTIERGVAAKADSKFYTGGPPLPAYESPFANTLQTDQAGIPPQIDAMRKRRQSLFLAGIAQVVRHSWKHTRTGSISKAYSKDLVFEPLETTGRASHQVLDLVGELVPPRPSFAASGQSTAPAAEKATDRDDNPSFLDELGGTFRFADLEVSSDEDLIEAGYRFFSHVEDPELAAVSRRSFLERIGLVPD